MPARGRSVSSNPWSTTWFALRTHRPSPFEFWGPGAFTTTPDWARKEMGWAPVPEAANLAPT
jgi:hypothetical protein